MTEIIDAIGKLSGMNEIFCSYGEYYKINSGWGKNTHAYYIINVMNPQDYFVIDRGVRYTEIPPLNSAISNLRIKGSVINEELIRNLQEQLNKKNS